MRPSTDFQLKLGLIDINQMQKETSDSLKHQSFHLKSMAPGSNFFEKTPLFFRYSGLNAANAANLQAKRR